jgi:hypothetical protein
MNKKQFCLINLKVSHFFNETDVKSQPALFAPRRFTEFKFKIKFQILLNLIAPIICFKCLIIARRKNILVPISQVIVRLLIYFHMVKKKSDHTLFLA